MADEEHFEFPEPGETAADGVIVAERPVAVQLDELVEDHLDVIHRLRAGRDAGRPAPFPRVSTRIGLAHEGVEFAADASDLLRPPRFRGRPCSRRVRTSSSS